MSNSSGEEGELISPRGNCKTSLFGSKPFLWLWLIFLFFLPLFLQLAHSALVRYSSLKVTTTARHILLHTDPYSPAHSSLLTAVNSKVPVYNSHQNASSVQLWAPSSLCKISDNISLWTTLSSQPSLFNSQFAAPGLLPFTNSSMCTTLSSHLLYMTLPNMLWLDKTKCKQQISKFFNNNLCLYQP